MIKKKFMARLPLPVIFRAKNAQLLKVNNVWNLFTASNHSSDHKFNPTCLYSPQSQGRWKPLSSSVGWGPMFPGTTLGDVSATACVVRALTWVNPIFQHTNHVFSKLWVKGSDLLMGLSEEEQCSGLGTRVPCFPDKFFDCFQGVSKQTSTNILDIQKLSSD